MKFAEIEYGDIKDGKIINWLNSVLHPFSAEVISAFGAEGYKIGINLSKDADEAVKERVLSKIKDFLEQNDVVTQTGININFGYYAEGKILGLIYASEKLRPEFEAVVVEGEKNLTETALCIVSPRVKFISLLCNDKNAYRRVWNYYFKEHGVNIQFINSFKHENFLNADMVINCKNIGRKNSYLAAKENALYAADEKIRSLSDINTDFIKKASLIENMDLTALTRY